jgi:hypothetical protein
MARRTMSLHLARAGGTHSGAGARGRVVHVVMLPEVVRDVEQRFLPALCGASPGLTGYGWTAPFPEPKRVTCLACWRRAREVALALDINPPRS